MAAFSAARLRRLHDVLAARVERGEMPGLVVAASRHGETHIDAIGVQGYDTGAPMRPDTIFRIASNSKPIVAAAAMTLVEEGWLRLDEPVDRWLPELANRQVLTRPDAPLDETVPANRPITVRDVLTFRLGYGHTEAPQDPWPIQRAMAALGLEPRLPRPSLDPPPDEWLHRLGSLPLLHQPGERWTYHIGSDVLGALIARVAGMPLEAVLRERVFEPLGMADTAFSVPEASRDRLATCYEADPDTPGLTLYDAADGDWSQPPAFPSGGGGLVSTTPDYLAFLRMLIDGGRYAGGRVLARPAVELMTMDHLTPEQKGRPARGTYWDAHGWGLGLGVVTRREDIGPSVGTFGWSGGFGTHAYADPREDVVTILLTQRGGPGQSAIMTDVFTLVYAAIAD